MKVIVQPFDTGIGKIPLSTILAKGDLIAGTAAATADNVSVGTDGQVLTADSSKAEGMTWASPAAVPPTNALINGGFDVYQRLVVPATSTAIADDVYGPDRWYVLTQSNNIEHARGNGDTNSKYCVVLKQAHATPQRIGLAQIIENTDTVPLRGRTVRFQIRANPSVSRAINVAILEWTGTADTVTSDVVADWTKTIAGGFFSSTTLASLVVTPGTATPGAGAWGSVYCTGTVSATATNLIVIVWTDTTMAQNETLSLTQAGLYDGTGVREWLPRPLGLEIKLCNRFFIRIGCTSAAPIGMGLGKTTSDCALGLTYPLMRLPTAGGNGTLANMRLYGVAVRTPTSVSWVAYGTTGSWITVTDSGAGLTAGQPYMLYTVDATGYLDLSAEL